MLARALRPGGVEVKAFRWREASGRVGAVGGAEFQKRRGWVVQGIRGGDDGLFRNVVQDLVVGFMLRGVFADTALIRANGVKLSRRAQTAIQQLLLLILLLLL